MQFKKILLMLILVLALPGCASNRQNQPISTVQKNTTSKIDSTKIDSNKNDSTKINTNKNESSESNTKKNNEPQIGSKTSPQITLNDISSLQRKTINWSWLYSPRDSKALLSKYQGYAFGDTSKKIIYLTFDEGYENGYTTSILNTLKSNNVKAAFFVTEPYVTGSFNGIKDVDLVKRMYDEGHIIGNHSVHHKSMSSITNEATFNSEITENETTVNNISGLKMSKFFRPPMGDFSELSLYYTQKLGYKSIFFALAYHDYDPKNQPNPEIAKENLLKQTKPGMICLLHAVSKTNAEILDSLIKEWKNQGYEFKTLNDLP